MLVGGANAHAHEIAGHQYLIAIRQDRAHGKRPGRPLDGGRHVIERAPIRISLIGLQADFDRILLQLFLADAEAPHVRTNIQHLLLIDIEIHVNWSGLHDSCELGRAVGSHHLA